MFNKYLLQLKNLQLIKMRNFSQNHTRTKYNKCQVLTIELSGVWRNQDKINIKIIEFRVKKKET